MIRYGMGKKWVINKVIYAGAQAEAGVITGGERQIVEMLEAFARNGMTVETVAFSQKEDAIRKMRQEIGRLGWAQCAEEVLFICDYSKRFELLKLVRWIRKSCRFHIAIIVGAFYFDYRASKIKNAVDYVVSALFLKNAGVLFTTGAAVNSRLNRMGLKKIEKKAFYPALRESLVRLSRRPGGEAARQDSGAGIKEILVIGRFHPVKGYEYLVEGIRLCKDRPDIHFTLVGDYERNKDYYVKIKNQLAEAGIEDQLTIYGRTGSDEELAGLYRRAYCCLHTSVWESSPITVCEALLFGKPVIATRVGGTAEYLTNGFDSILIPAKSGAAVGRAVIRLCDDPAYYGALARHAAISAEKYTNRAWKDVGEEYYRYVETM